MSSAAAPANPFANLQQIEGVLVPYHYEVWGDGVYDLTGDCLSAGEFDHRFNLPSQLRDGRKRIIHRPLWLSGIGVAVDTDEPLLQLSYLMPDGTKKAIWVDRADVVDHRLLAKLGGHGLPVDSLNARDVLLYLRNAETVNGKAFASVRVGHRSGPYVLTTSAGVRQFGWLLGARWFGPGTLQPDPRGHQKHITGLSSAGSWEEWRDKWGELYRRSWVPRWLIACAFAPPLLRYCKVRSFIVHHWGESSKSGKTASAIFANSAWGNPQAEPLWGSMNRTDTSITEVFRHLTDLPVLYDEKQVSKIESDSLIYQVCMGAGRERATRNGGLRADTPTWLTVARTTGEEPLVKSNDLGGQQNRVIQIHSLAFDSEKDAEKIYPFTEANHGHAGPMFLERLCDMLNSGCAPQILETFNGLRAEIAKALGRDANHAAYTAVIALAQTLSAVWLLGIDPAEARETAISDALQALSETAPLQVQSYADKAMTVLRDHWMSWAHMAYADTTSSEEDRRSFAKARMVGVEVPEGMAYLPSLANELLVNAQLSPERVWRDFAKNGWLITGEKSLLTTSTLRGKSFDHPVYVIKREAFMHTHRPSFLKVVQDGVLGPTAGARR